MKAVYLNVKDCEKAQVIEIEDELAVFYDLIGCSLITVTERKIGEHYYDIIADDEGLFVENPKVSALDEIGHGALVGNLIVVKHDGNGKFQGLTDEEAQEVLSAEQLVFSENHDEPYWVLNLNS